MPADDQAMALPCASVMVIIVLLKLAFTWATPAVMFLRSRRRRRCGSRAISIYPLLLLAGDRPSLALAGAGVGVGALAADGQALAVAEAAIAGQVHQPLDVHRRLAAEVALHIVLGVDRLAQVEDLLIGEFLDPPLGRD